MSEPDHVEKEAAGEIDEILSGILGCGAKSYDFYLASRRTPPDDLVLAARLWRTQRKGVD
jgi:hypothetical protein